MFIYQTEKLCVIVTNTRPNKFINELQTQQFFDPENE